MSAIYNLEPQPTGSVILHTTIGELSVELFAKQTPLTCRNFLQLCMDGYYDDTIFHRLVPGFILQGGDPTGTGHGGESIYDAGALSGDLDPWPMDMRHGRNAGPTGIGFKDEFHSRLKFNRRGLLGMANESTPDTNGSQFFFTLDKADELTGKNTLFGRIAGDTIYTLAKIGESEVDEATERPLYPVKIVKVEILVNPFEGMTGRARQAPIAQKTVVVERKKKRKGGKQLLSFGDEEGEEEELPILKKPKFDTRIVMDDGADAPPSTENTAEKKKKKKKKDQSPEPSQPTTTEDTLPLQSAKPVAEEKAKRESKRYESYSPEPEPPRRRTALEKTNDEIAALKASMKRTVHTPQEVVKEQKKSALEQMLSGTAVKGGRRRGRQNVNEDQRSVDIMMGWEMKLKTAQPDKEKRPHRDAETESRGKDAADDDDEGDKCDLHFVPNCQSCRAWDTKEQGEEIGDEGFMAHTMNCKADKLGKDLSYRKKAEEELIVIDPRAKALSIKEQKKANREARAGKSGREWDRARNAQMARAASTAGRGAV